MDNNQQRTWQPPYLGILVLINGPGIPHYRPFCSAQEHQRKGHSPLTLCNLLLLILVITLGLDISLISLLMPSLFQTNRRYIIIPGLRKRTPSAGPRCQDRLWEEHDSPDREAAALCPCSPPRPCTGTGSFVLLTSSGSYVL